MNLPSSLAFAIPSAATVPSPGILFNGGLIAPSSTKNFVACDLYKSHGTKFIMEEDGIRPPLNSIPGLGTVAAEGINDAKKEGKFMSIDDLQIKSKVGKSVIELLEKAGCLVGMSKSNQISLFG